MLTKSVRKIIDINIQCRLKSPTSFPYIELAQNMYFSDFRSLSQKATREGRDFHRWTDDHEKLDFVPGRLVHKPIPKLHSTSQVN
jgi:hypothetical protein